MSALAVLVVGDVVAPFGLGACFGCIPAMWIMKWSGAAPCQCHSPGGVSIESPGSSSMISPPRDWANPRPSVT